LPDGKRAEGNWWTESNLVCAEMEERGHLHYTYHRVEPMIYVCWQPEGICDVTARIVSGNIEGL